VDLSVGAEGEGEEEGVKEGGGVVRVAESPGGTVTVVDYNLNRPAAAAAAAVFTAHPLHLVLHLVLHFDSAQFHR
jgi:hypothetical protein